MTLYAMNTRTRVSTEDPSANEFGHTLDGCTFVYLRSTAGAGTAVKVWSTYGDPQLSIGERVNMINDTGLGHRSMPTHVVVAILSKDKLSGDLPAQRKIPYWVAK
jgi:hypothetical protein